VTQMRAALHAILLDFRAEVRNGPDINEPGQARGNSFSTGKIGKWERFTPRKIRNL